MENILRLALLGTSLLLQASASIPSVAHPASCWSRAETIDQASTRLWKAGRLSAASLERERSARFAEECKDGGQDKSRHLSLLIAAENLVIAGELAHGAGEKRRAIVLVREGAQKLRLRLRIFPEVDADHRSVASEVLERAVGDLHGEWGSMSAS